MTERRIVSVLFADVVGFTSLAETLDPEDLATVQDAYFAAASRTLEGYGGRIEKFIGDAVLAVFGVPRAREDDAERAVRGGLALHAAVSTLAAELGLDAGALLIRVGVNTGEVAYTPGAERVTGDAVNVAARLQTASPPGRVAIGPDTALAVADAFELEPLGGVDLKGKAAAVHGSLVAGTRARASRDAALGRLKGATIGRRDEVAALREDVRAAGGGPGWTMLVAPPGVGKSRVVSEFLRAVRGGDDHVRVLAARCTAEPSHPYEPVADLLVEALRASGVDPSAHRAALVSAAEPLLRERVGASGVPGADHVVAQTVALLAGSPSELEVDRLTRFAAWATVFDILEDGAATIWVVEDVHDASGDALSFLASAASGEARGGRFLVMTARPAILAHDPSWREVASHGTGRLTQLEPLTSAGAAELVRQLVGDALPDPLVERIGEASGGNPLFVEELLRTWLILGVLRETYDGFELQAEPGDLHVPTTVQVLYSAQLDDLPLEARTTAQHGAVIGREFAVAGLDAITPGRSPDGLAVLRDRVLIDGPHEGPTGAAYTFRHALLRQAAYRTLSRSDRAAFHVAVASWLQDGSAGDEEHAPAIAHHYGAAVATAPRLMDPVAQLPRTELLDHARAWRLRAARAALRSSALDDATHHVEVLHELLEGEPDTHPMRAAGAEIAGVACANSDLDLGASWLRRALTLYERGLTDGHDQEAALGYVRTTVALARLRYDQLAFDDTLALAERALDLVASVVPEQDQLRLRAWRLRGLSAMAAADQITNLAPEVTELLADAERIGDEHAVFDAHGVRFEVGLVPEGESAALAADQAARAERLGLWGDVVVQRRILAGDLVQRSSADALEAARGLPGLARSFGLVEAEAFATYAVVEAALAAGEWSLVVDAGSRALDLADRHHVGRAYVRTAFALLPVAVLRGEVALTERMTERLEAHRMAHPDLSSYARVVQAGVRRWVGRDPHVGDDPTPADLAAMFPANPSGASQAEITVRAWLETGRHRDVSDALAGVADHELLSAGARTFAEASHQLVHAWAALASGDVDAAVVAAGRCREAAVACGAPWWEARAVRVLEAAGVADPADIERRVRLEVALGVQAPQPPPVVPA